MRKNQKGFGLVEILVLVIVIAIIGALGWIFFSKHNKDATQATTSTASITQPEDITAKIKSNWANKYTLLNIDENSQPASGELSIRIQKSSPAYKAEGFNFYTSYDGGSTLDAIPYDSNPDNTTFPKTADTTLRNEIAAVYKEFGLSKTETTGSKEFTNETDIYTGKGLICTVEIPNSATSSDTASCGLIEAYTASAEKIKPLADAIPDVDSATSFSEPSISDSPVSGYQKATIGMANLNSFTGSQALLYKKDSGTWKYFKNTQDSLYCSEYNTADLKNAFKGEPCVGADGQSTKVE